MYIVYETKNKVNEKIYIGVHKTDNPNDSYLGSGSAIKSAIKIYGRKNFSKRVLFIFSDSKDAYEKEREVVNEEFLSRNDTYNLTKGGIPSIDSLNDSRIYQKHRHTQRNRIWINNSIINRLHPKELSLPEGWIKGKIQKKIVLSEEQKLRKNHQISISNKGRISPMKGKTLTQEDKAKKSVSALNRVKMICEYCQKTVDPGNYSRWHGVKCVSG